MGFRGSNASGRRIVLPPAAFLAAQCFQNGHFGRIFSTLHFTVFQSLGGHASARRMWHEPCSCQAHCFMQGPLRFFPVLPNPTCTRSHICGLLIFPVFAKGANTGAACILTEMNSSTNLANMCKILPQNISLYLRECEDRSRMCSRKNEFPYIFLLHVLVLCRGVA